MNYTNLPECVNYIVLRLKMNLSKNLKNSEIQIFKNTKTNYYTLYVLIFDSSNIYKFKFIINKIINNKKIDILINSLFDMIEKKCFSTK